MQSTVTGIQCRVRWSLHTPTVAHLELYFITLACFISSGGFAKLLLNGYGLNYWMLKNVCTSDVYTSDVCTSDVCTSDVCTSDVCTSDVCTSDVCTSDVYTSDVCASDVCTSDVYTSNVCTSDVYTVLIHRLL